MRRLLFPLCIFMLASPLLAAPPTDGEIGALYALYQRETWPETCWQSPPGDCPPALTDPQARAEVLKAYYCRPGAATAQCDVIKAWKLPPRLSFDHRLRDWSADDRIEDATDEDVNGLPTVTLRGRQSVVVVVTDTNPLLFTVSPGEVKLQPIEQFADLQKLAGLIGGNVSAILQVRASERAVLGMSDDGELKEAAELVMAAVAPFREAAQLAECTTLEVQKAAAFVQAVEVARAAEYPRAMPICNGTSISGAVLRGQTAKLEAAKAQLSSTLATRCATVPDAAVQVLDVDPADDKAVKAAIAKYKAVELDPACIDWQAAPDVIGDLADRLIDPIQKELALPTPDLPAVYEDLRSEVGADVKKLAGAMRAAKAAQDATPKLIEALPAIAKAAENLELFRARLLQNVAGPVADCAADPALKCIPQSAVATFLVVTGEPSAVTRWELVHTRPINIALDSPYSADVVARRTAAATSYSFRSALASIFDLGVSVTETDLQSPTFGVVQVDHDGDSATATKKLIGVIDQESQSGKLALMLNVVPLRLFDVPKVIAPLGLQVGAAVDSSKPGLFWGISYGLGKYARVGWGRTAQRVSVLRPETPLGHEVFDANDIRKRQKYERDEYWSLMVSIRALSLFTSPK